jgi:hypothetical protein
MALALALTGCGPGPDIDPTPTFSSEAEAFAAAKATYRAYVDALNEVDLSDPETFEGVYSWTTGEANASARQTFSEMHANEWDVAGHSVPTTIELSDQSASEVSLAVCVDVSEVKLIDASGRSVVEADRPDVQTMLVTLVPSAATTTRLIISNFGGREGAPECG